MWLSLHHKRALIFSWSKAWDTFAQNNCCHKNFLVKREVTYLLNLVRNGSPWSHLVFEKEVISHSKYLNLWKSSGLESFSCICWKHTHFSKSGVFSFIISLHFWAKIIIVKEFYCFMHTFGYSKWEHWSLITTLFKFGLNWSLNLQENCERKNPLLHYLVRF